MAVPAMISAEVWKYTDKNGITHFVDSVKKIPEQFRTLGTQVEKGQVSRGGRASYDGAKTATVTNDTKVEIFVTSWCGYCRALEDHLQKKQIPFKRYDIERDKEAGARYKQFRRPGVPLSVINGQLISGFNRREIDRAVKGL